MKRIIAALLMVLALPAYANEAAPAAQDPASAMRTRYWP